MKRLVLTAVIVAAVSARGEAPFAGMCGDELRLAIGLTCTPQSQVDDARQWMARRLTDDAGMLWLPFEQSLVEAWPIWPDDVMTVELLPREWWRFDPDASARRVWLDMVNIFPATFALNSSKVDYPPFTVDNVTATVGAFRAGTVTVAGVETNAWEPPAQMKGDVARVVMYMTTLYPSDLLDPRAVLVADAGGLSAYGRDLMLQWSREDPVDEAERYRNALIAAAQGGCGNPFVEWAGLEEYVWGDKRNEPFSDGEVAPGQPVALRGSYSLTDSRIDLWSPYVADDAAWTVNGEAVAASYLVPSELGAGRHTLAYTAPDGERGSVIITIK